jgi:hypothetical protein
MRIIPLLFLYIVTPLPYIVKGQRRGKKKEEGRRKKEEGRRKREECRVLV